MFNKNTSTYLIPHPSSSFDVNGVEILLHHHRHHDLFSGAHYAPNIIEPGFNNVELQSDSLPRKQQQPPVKKDRHSKIYTAAGPRDRRVRLSIGIARKFFDLQETLGFDKPSKTLDWLFTKSKEAIKDLVAAQSKQKTSADTTTTSSPSECELISSENGEDSKKKSSYDKGAKYLAKESRAKARARARERTREKMCIKQLSGASNNNGFSSYNVPCSLANEGHDLIEVKRKTTKSPSFFGFQQNGSRDLSSNYIIPSANPNENWDVCNFNSQSNLYAILDHHKFINSNSNI